MAGTPNAADLERLLAERGRQLMQVAIALTGSRPAGEDLLQAALERVLRKPRQVDSDTEGYLRPRLTCRTVFSQIFVRAWRVTIPKALRCGVFHLAGRQQVDGVTAMTLIAKPQPGFARLELWIDPATYLQVRLDATFQAGHGPQSLLRNDYRWLPPTKANLAALHAAIRRATIPASFRKLPANYLPLAGGKDTRG
jgi:hypothetical protein